MEIENQFGNNGEVRTYEQTPNFSVGLRHVLSGIIAHLSSTVISATMAWQPHCPVMGWGTWGAPQHPSVKMSFDLAEGNLEDIDRITVHYRVPC